VKPEEAQELQDLWQRLRKCGGLGVGDFHTLVALLMEAAVELAEASPDHLAAQAVLAGAGRTNVQRKLF
jgi:hypothetical protein